MRFIDDLTRSDNGIASENGNDTFLKNKRSKFIEFLKLNNIEYEHIDYKNNKQA